MKWEAALFTIWPRIEQIRRVHRAQASGKVVADGRRVSGLARGIGGREFADYRRISAITIEIVCVTGVQPARNIHISAHDVIKYT
jgi:hypothetical protein